MTQAEAQLETFTIAPDGKSITCKRCLRTSHHPKDVELRYCGACHVFHDDLWPPIRKQWLENFCSCGQPPHYTNSILAAAMALLVSEHGRFVKVTTPAGSWMVCRHYIAPHGIKEADLPELARKFNWPQVPPVGPV